MAEEKTNKPIEEYMNSLTEEQRLQLALAASVMKDVEEEEKRREKYEKRSTIVTAICFVIGLICGIKYCFMDPEHGFMVDLITTAIVIGILVVIGQAILGACINPEDL